MEKQAQLARIGSASKGQARRPGLTLRIGTINVAVAAFNLVRAKASENPLSSYTLHEKCLDCGQLDPVPGKANELDGCTHDQTKFERVHLETGMQPVEYLEKPGKVKSATPCRPIDAKMKVKGIEHGGRLLTFTDDELSAFAVRKEGIASVEAAEDASYPQEFVKSRYAVEPEDTITARALFGALQRSGKALRFGTVEGGIERDAYVRWKGSVLVMEVLHVPSEVVAETPLSIAEPAQYMALMDKLLAGLASKAVPVRTNVKQQALDELIAAKALAPEGEQVKVASEPIKSKEEKTLEQQLEESLLITAGK